VNLKSSLRRTAVLTAGALIGLSGAFALTGPAAAHHNVVSGAADCDETTGDWLVTWDVVAYGNAATYEWTDVKLTPEGTKISNDDFLVNGKDLTNAQKVTGVQRVAGKESSSTLTVAAKWKTGDATATGTATFSGKCEKTTAEEPPPVDEEPPPAEEEPPVPADLPGEPTPIFEADCDTMTIGLDNPKNGVEITLDFKTSKGEERKLVIKPGEKKSETFSATTGFSIKLTFSATIGGEPFKESTTIEYEQPEDCDNSGGGGGLPLTGAAAGSIAGGAGAMLAIGAVLFLMARRRKVKFTA
jgi:LPXTG-motif cell wall-anchored protein